tara:strand:- start:749 stop:1114 length:366 start_codon:yes stop_codon:yes gene_type:complete
MKFVQSLRIISLISFFGLMISLLVWILIAEHSENFPVAAWLIIGVVPLLFPMRGILYGKTYTHAWASFLMLFYIAHGIGELYSRDAVVWYPLLEVIFSSSFFVAANLYVRTSAKLRKKSQT